MKLSTITTADLKAVYSFTATLLKDIEHEIEERDYCLPPCPNCGAEHHRDLFTTEDTFQCCEWLWIGNTWLAEPKF